MKKALGIILITTLLLGIASTIATLIQPKEQPLKITLPLAPGDKLVYQVTIYIIENGTLTPITNKTVEITIEKLGWPLTNTSIGEIPTSQLLIPPQLVILHNHKTKHETRPTNILILLKRLRLHLV